MLPLALGHLACVGLVVATVGWGLSPDRAAVQAGAAALMGLALAWPLLSGRACRPALHAGLALGAFLLSSLHGAGLALVPALLPLCGGAA